MQGNSKQLDQKFETFLTVSTEDIRIPLFFNPDRIGMYNIHIPNL